MGEKQTKAYWFFLGDTGVRIFGFFTTILLARILGVESYGLLSIAVAVLGVASWLSDPGLGTLGARNLARPKHKRISTVGEILRIRILLGFTVFFSISFLIWGTHFHSFETGLVIQLFLLSLIPNALLLEWYFNASKNYKWITYSRLAQASLYLMLVYLLINPSDITLVPILYFFSVTGAAVILYVALPSMNEIRGNWPSYHKFREVILTALPLGLGTFFIQVVIFMPPLVIGYYFGFREAGLFGVAIKIILFCILIDRFLIKQLLPNISELWDENHTKLKKHIQRSLHWMIFTGCLFALILNTGAEFFIHFFFGDAYHDSSLLLRILSFYLPLAFINSLFTYGLISFKQDLSYLRSGLKGGIAAFFILLIISSIGSLEWVAWAVVLSEAVILIFFYTEFHKYIQPDFITPILRLIGPALIFLFLPIAGWITYPLSLTLLPMLYIFTVFLIRGMNTQDILWIRMMLFKEEIEN